MKEAKNLLCPFCGHAVAGMGRNYYNNYITITCTNPECNASTHFKTKSIQLAMDRYQERTDMKPDDLGLLRSCPFCGEAASLYSDGKVYVAGCTTPECRGNVNDTSGGWNTPDKAMNKWNERGKHDNSGSEESNAGVPRP